jgi:PAS domain S-box-containing protein
VFPVEVSGRNIKIENKTYLQEIVRDITERKQAEDALRESEEKYRTLFETMAQGVVYQSADGKIFSANHAAERILGLTLDQMQGRTSMDPRWKAIHEDGSDFPGETHPAIIALKTGKEVKDVVMGVFNPGDEQYHWISIYATPQFRPGESKRYQVYTTFADITERRRTERLLEDIFTTSTIGMYIVQDRKLQLVNPQFQKLTGYSQAKLVGIDPLDIVLPQDRDMVKKNAVNMLKGQHSSVYEFRYVTKSGQVRWATESVVSIVYQGKQAALGSFIDTTESKKMEEQWLMTSKLASIGELAAGVAHEINNPLTGVMGYAQLLMDKQAVSQDVKDDLQKIYEESQRAVKIVQNLLRFARRYKPEKEHADINDLLERTLELEGYKLRTSNISLTINLVPELPLILADSNQLQQVILNLITNAEQAMVRTKRKGKITVTTEKVKDYVRIAITDNGPGISPEHITRIFDPFFTTKEVGSGTGLGLSVSHGIITEHGGRIYAESESGKGATFIIELPVAVEGQQSAVEKEKKAAKAKSHRPRQKATGNILIVEDEPSIRSILTRPLSNTGHQAQAVSNGKTALRKLAENVYDLLIVDLKMSGLSGRELYEIMKKSHPNMAKRVVFITGDTVTPETHNFLVSTGRQYLSKPFNPREITDIIEKASAER